MKTDALQIHQPCRLNSRRIPRALAAITFLATASLTLLIQPLRADWTQWRGTNRDGKASGFTAPQTWPKELVQKWKTAVGEGVATPALVGDKLYVFSREGGDEIIRCLESATGKEVWQYKYEAQGPAGPASAFPGPRSSPAVADGKVVTLGVRGVLCCLDAASGKLLWRKDDFNAWPNFFAASSPLILDGICIAQLGGQGKGGIEAYDLATGETKWTWTGDGPAYASPAVMDVGGTKLIAAMTERKIVALNAADGKLVWETPFAGSGMGSYNAATPIIEGQTLVYAGSKRGIKAVKFEKEGDTFTAKELWSNPDQSVQFNTPVLKEGFLYGLTQGNEFFCISASTGQTAWTAPIGAAAAPAPAPGGGGGGRRGGGMRGGGGFGSIVDAGTVLLALTPSSELIVIQPNEKAYTELARIKVADSPTHAYPIATSNGLFVKDKDSVMLWALQ